jgi:hypothetical protein
MKTFAFLFSFYILFLAVLPSFANNIAKSKTRCHQKACCHKAKSAQQSKNNNCPKGNCTPFFGCNNIQVIVPQIEKSLSVDVIKIKKITVYLDFFTSDFYAKSWHPPRSL